MPRRRTTHESITLPHSWSFSNWPVTVFPGDERRAKYLFRTSQRDLLAEGACARIGRAIVFCGEQYSRYLRKRAARIPDFTIAPNREGAERPIA